MVHRRIVQLGLLAAMTLQAVGCADEAVDSGLCRAATEHVSSCLGLETASTDSACDEVSAQAALDASCDELGTGTGKADSLGELRALLCRLGNADYCTACGSYGRGLWVWGTDAALDVGARRALFEFAASRRIDTLYLDAEAIVTAQRAAANAFVTAAAAGCLETELLFGAPEWALGEHHDVPLALAQAAAGLRAAGIHFDIEPYALPAWSSEPQAVANQYLDLLDSLGPLAAEAELRLSVDTPFWFDEQLVTRSGTTRPLSEWVADRVDRVVLMDYRDQVAGSDGLVAHATAELGYAGAIGRGLVVGVETACGLLPKTTFCEEGAPALEAALAATVAALGDAPGFAGVAIHHYDAFQAL